MINPPRDYPAYDTSMPLTRNATTHRVDFAIWGVSVAVVTFELVWHLWWWR